MRSVARVDLMAVLMALWTAEPLCLHRVSHKLRMHLETGELWWLQDRRTGLIAESSVTKTPWSRFS